MCVAMFMVLHVISGLCMCSRACTMVSYSSDSAMMHGSVLCSKCVMRIVCTCALSARVCVCVCARAHAYVLRVDIVCVCVGLLCEWKFYECMQCIALQR